MFKHLFKLIWNKKKQNFLLICEMLVSFMVIFAVFTLIVNYYQNYKEPMGFEYDNVWAINYHNSKQFKSTDSMTTYYNVVTNTLKSMPKIRAVSFASSNTPFANATMLSGFDYNHKTINNINNYQAQEGYRDVLGLNVLEGRWFNKSDAASANQPIVINATLRDALFGKGKAIGQVIGDVKEKESKKMRVIGVVQDIKDKGDYYKGGRGMYRRIDTGSFRWLSHIIIKVAPDADAAFESHLYKAMANSMKDATVEIVHLNKRRDAMNRSTFIPMIILLIIAGFLIINVALGIFGVLWYNINKRRGEIGLRRAIGATGNSVSMQLVTEALILATFSLIIGAFFAIQFPLLHVFDLPAGVYMIALILAVIFIYLLVLICSLYPGKQAAAIYPAVALHEE